MVTRLRDTSSRTREGGGRHGADSSAGEQAIVVGVALNVSLMFRCRCGPREREISRSSR